MLLVHADKLITKPSASEKSIHTRFVSLNGHKLELGDIKHRSQVDTNTCKVVELSIGNHNLTLQNQTSVALMPERFQSDA